MTKKPVGTLTNLISCLNSRDCRKLRNNYPLVIVDVSMFAQWLDLATQRFGNDVDLGSSS